MYSRLFLLAASFAFVFVVWVGCDDAETCDCERTPEERIATIVIGSGSVHDTLEFLPSDSASVAMWALASDAEGSPVSGAALAITVSNPALGVIAFLNDSEQNITQADGRVMFVYRSFALEGSQTIYACANGICEHVTFYSAPASPPAVSVTIETDCDSIIADPNAADSCRICVVLHDSENHPVEGVALTIRATGGRFPIFPVTDSLGRSCIYWHFRDSTFGQYCFYVLSDSTCFTLPG